MHIPKPFPGASQQKYQINTVILFFIIIEKYFVGLLLRTKMIQSLNKTEKKNTYCDGLYY